MSSIRSSTRLLAIGEVMAEIRAQDDGFVVGFAGDTYNTAVYAARQLGAPGQVGYVTRIGREPLSRALLDNASAEGLDVSHVALDETRNIGIYAVATDAHGERSFSYWRADSAARQLFAVEETALFMPKAEIIYLSGITLAILTPAGRSRLFQMLADARAASGTRIAFDSNFRPALWPDHTTARQTMDRMWSLTDIALPSIDDEMALYGLDSEDAVIARFAARDWDGIAIKRGVRGPISPLLQPDDLPDFPPAARVIDTTAAGDSFNGGYLAAFLTGAAEAERLAAGHRMAATVVAAPGAIIPHR
jgi:2-dehydro-3-deoxygluconokinase